MEVVIERFKEEVELIRQMQHPNIVRFLGACLEPITPGAPVPDLMRNTPVKVRNVQ